jgi:hypothetical protein
MVKLVVPLGAGDSTPVLGLRGPPVAVGVVGAVDAVSGAGVAALPPHPARRLAAISEANAVARMRFMPRSSSCDRDD